MRAASLIADIGAGAGIPGLVLAAALPDARPLLHSFVNEMERSVGTYLYGRRMYETMVFWETAHLTPGIEQGLSLRVATL